MTLIPGMVGGGDDAVVHPHKPLACLNLKGSVTSQSNRDSVKHVQSIHGVDYWDHKNNLLGSKLAVINFEEILTAVQNMP